jgi:hypothetical protein
MHAILIVELHQLGLSYESHIFQPERVRDFHSSAEKEAILVGEERPLRSIWMSSAPRRPKRGSWEAEVTGLMVKERGEGEMLGIDQRTELRQLSWTRDEDVRILWAWITTTMVQSPFLNEEMRRRRRAWWVNKIDQMMSIIRLNSKSVDQIRLKCHNKSNLDFFF